MREEEKKARDVIENLEPIKSLETDKEITIKYLKEMLKNKSGALSPKAILSIKSTLSSIEGRACFTNY